MPVKEEQKQRQFFGYPNIFEMRPEPTNVPLAVVTTKLTLEATKPTKFDTVTFC